mgnify:CR=1 FL=1|jgi:hypothetical protein
MSEAGKKLGSVATAATDSSSANDQGSPGKSGVILRIMVRMFSDGAVLHRPRPASGWNSESESPFFDGHLTDINSQ